MGLLHFVGWRWILLLRSSGSSNHLKSFGKTILNRKAWFWSTIAASIAIATAGNLLIFLTSPAKWKHTFNSKRDDFFLTSSSVNQNLVSSGNEDSIWLVSSIHGEEIHMFVWMGVYELHAKKIQTELHSIKRLTSWRFFTAKARSCARISYIWKDLQNARENNCA